MSHGPGAAALDSPTLRRAPPIGASPGAESGEEVRVGALTRRRLLWCAATDSSFHRIELADGPALAGKCLHCGRKLVLRTDGEPVSRATIEHIVPRNHGGGDDLQNLGIACARCNHGKGVRHDGRRLDDPKLRAVIATLQQRRRQRWREPPSDWDLPPRP